MDGAQTGLAIVVCAFATPLVVLFGVFVVACAWHPIAAMMRQHAEARAMEAQQRRLLAIEVAKQEARAAWEAAHPEEMEAMRREQRAIMDYLTGGGGIWPDPRQRPEPDWRRAVATPESKPYDLPLWPPGMGPAKPKSKASDGVPSAEDLRRQFRLPAKRDGMLR